MSGTLGGSCDLHRLELEARKGTGDRIFGSHVPGRGNRYGWTLGTEAGLVWLGNLKEPSVAKWGGKWMRAKY